MSTTELHKQKMFLIERCLVIIINIIKNVQVSMRVLSDIVIYVEKRVMQETRKQALIYSFVIVFLYVYIY